MLESGWACTLAGRWLSLGLSPRRHLCFVGRCLCPASAFGSRQDREIWLDEVQRGWRLEGAKRLEASIERNPSRFLISAPGVGIRVGGLLGLNYGCPSRFWGQSTPSPTTGPLVNGWMRRSFKTTLERAAKGSSGRFGRWIVGALRHPACVRAYPAEKGAHSITLIPMAWPLGFWLFSQRRNWFPLLFCNPQLRSRQTRKWDRDTRPLGPQILGAGSFYASSPPTFASSRGMRAHPWVL